MGPHGAPINPIRPPYQPNPIPYQRTLGTQFLIVVFLIASWGPRPGSGPNGGDLLGMVWLIFLSFCSMFWGPMGPINPIRSPYQPNPTPYQPTLGPGISYGGSSEISSAELLPLAGVLCPPTQPLE